MASLLFCIIVGVLCGSACYITFKKCYSSDIEDMSYLKTKLEEDVAHLHSRIDYLAEKL